jgi:hypothetical protein
MTDKGLVYVPKADYWLRNGRYHRRLVLAPPGSPQLPLRDDDHNLWQGFAVEPKPGDWTLNRQHIRDIICGGDRRLEKWLHNWIAALVQRPGQHAWTAPLLRGGQGVGKGHLVSTILGKLFRAPQFAHLTRPEHLTGDFNEHLSSKVLVFADEAFWGDKGAANDLKGLITEDSIWINEKHLPKRSEPSSLHVIIASNADRPVPVERDDRRFVVFDVDESKKNDQAYFTGLHHELDNGGREALLHYFLSLAIDPNNRGNRPAAPPSWRGGRKYFRTALLLPGERK